MCGIVGAVSGRDVVDLLLEGIRRLEYRGYDSAGIAVLQSNDILSVVRAVGRISALEQKLQTQPMQGHVGIIHTRWATHGVPSERNAHPHASSDSIAVVHNGIIENHEELRQELLDDGFTFKSDTDTEVIAHSIFRYMKNKHSFLDSVHKTVNRLKGAYALAIISAFEPDKLIAVRYGSPLVVGLGIAENFVASDAIALLPMTNKFIYMDSGDIAVVERTQVQIYDSELNKVDREIKISATSVNAVELGDYQYFMQKEIFEQAHTLAENLEDRFSGDDKVIPEIFGNKAKEVFKEVKRVQIVACGSSFHAALIGKYWLEKYANLPCSVEIGSELRSRSFIVVEEGTLFVTVSQSGETADTLAALRLAKTLPFLSSLTICNVPESSLTRESDLVFMTRTGVEIGVATTKAFTAQLTALLLLAMVFCDDKEVVKTLIRQLKHLPSMVEKLLSLDGEISQIAKNLKDNSSAFFLGRGIGWPLAMEGALKLKEISYIHAEGYPAGELKHGPIALIDQNTPVIVIMPNDSIHDKLKSNLQEVSARGGKLIIFADESLHFTVNPDWVICRLPKVAEDMVPMAYAIPLQLFAYHVALLRGTDVDKPRNLAKSVTVE